jgi:hypothetical protein
LTLTKNADISGVVTEARNDSIKSLRDAHFKNVLDDIFSFPQGEDLKNPQYFVNKQKKLEEFLNMFKYSRKGLNFLEGFNSDYIFKFYARQYKAFTERLLFSIESEDTLKKLFLKINFNINQSLINDNVTIGELNVNLSMEDVLKKEKFKNIKDFLKEKFIKEFFFLIIYSVETLIFANRISPL